MANPETQTDPKPTASIGPKRKNSRIVEALVVTFVVATTLLVLAEVSTNVVNELDGQGIAIISAPQVQPTVTATPTLTPEELQEILRQSTISN